MSTSAISHADRPVDSSSVEVEVPRRLRDRLLVAPASSASSKRRDSASPRVFSASTDCWKIASRRAASSARMRCASFSSGLFPRSGSLCDTTRPEIRVDDQRRLAARAGHFELGFEPRHLGSLPEHWSSWPPGTTTASQAALASRTIIPSVNDDGSTTLRIVTYNIHRCRGMDRRTRPERIAAVLRDSRRRRRRAAGSHRRRPERRQPHRGDRRRARHGLGDGAGAPAARPPVRQRRPQPLSDHAPRRARPVVEDVRSARACSASDVDVHGQTLHVYNVHLGTAHPRAPPSGRAPRGRSSSTATSRGPKLVLGDFNEWMRGLTTTLLSSAAEERRPAVAI